MPPIPKIKRFARGDRLYVQAQQVWLILVSYAGVLHKTIAYGELAEAMGYDPRAGYTLGRHLGLVGEFCKANRLPLLNTIVVNQITGMPGDEVVVQGKRTPETIKKEQQSVLRYNWFSIRVPTTGTFRQTLNSIPSLRRH